MQIPYELIRAYQAGTFRTAPGMRISTRDEAVDFVNQRGFVHFWPIKGITFPSLWTAVAGDRPVADEHDDPGHVTWGWKDALLGSRVWYYAKALRKKSSMISLEVLPYFYALTENYGSPEEDYLTLYQQGRLTQEAKTIYEVLLNQGPLDTIALRKAARLSSKESDSRFNKSLVDLQADFKILPVAVTQAGAWHYAFAYDIVTRHYPELIDQTRFISERQAYHRLAELYFRSVGAAQLRDLVKLFAWPHTEAERAVNQMVDEGTLYKDILIENQPGTWIVLRELSPQGR
jgi:hypothetical protein